MIGAPGGLRRARAPCRRWRPGTLADDLARRDFTVNAMALRLGGPGRGAGRPARRRGATSTARLIGLLRPDAFDGGPEPAGARRPLRGAARLRARAGHRGRPRAAAAPGLDLGVAPGWLASCGGCSRRPSPAGALRAARRPRACRGSPGCRAPPSPRSTPPPRHPARRTCPGGRCAWARRCGPGAAGRARRCPGGRARPAREAAAGAALAARAGRGRGALRGRPRCCARAPPGDGRRRAGGRRRGRRRRWWSGDRDRDAAVRGADLVAAGVPPGPAIGRALAAVRAARARRPGGRRATSSSRWPSRLAPGSTRDAPEVIEIATGAPGAGGVHDPPRAASARGRFAALNLGLGPRRRRRRRAREPRAASATRSGSTPSAVSAGPPGARRRGARRVDAASRRRRSSAHLRGWPEGDGLVTGAPGAGWWCSGADCLPVLLWRRDRPPVAAAHAGWRGLVAGVLEAAVRGARATRSGWAPPIGPGIGPCCYPVSAEVRERFAARVRRGGGAAARRSTWPPPRARALVAAGVARTARSQTVTACTRCEPERFFSYRRDGRGTRAPGRGRVGGGGA